MRIDPLGARRQAGGQRRGARNPRCGKNGAGQFKTVHIRHVMHMGRVELAAQRRAQGLAAFYGGPVWQAHRDAANATMVDSDDVFLLRPAWPGAGIDGETDRRPQPGAADTPAGLLDVDGPHAAGRAAR